MSHSSPSFRTGSSATKKIKDEKIRNTFFEILKYEAKIPFCLRCGKLFDLGFPNNEAGFCDNLICRANDLICICVNNQKIKELYSKKEDGPIDISEWYVSER